LELLAIGFTNWEATRSQSVHRTGGGFENSFGVAGVVAMEIL
jgi:hypothetical protein